MQRLTIELNGVFDPHSWIEEGDGLYASARTARAVWTAQRRNLKRNLKRSGPNGAKVDWPRLKGMPRASMLLLAYSTEMYLKSGLAKAYRGCSEEFFKHLSSRKFGHRLHALAKDIEFPDADKYNREFKILSDMMLETARYPITPSPGADYSNLINERTRTIWDSKSFRAYSRLARSIRKHSTNIDENSKDTAFFVGYMLDKTGYFASRVGGGLQPRLIVKYSDEMKAAGKADHDTLKKMLEANNFGSVTFFWDRYRFITDKGSPY